MMAARSFEKSVELCMYHITCCHIAEDGNLLPLRSVLVRWTIKRFLMELVGIRYKWQEESTTSCKMNLRMAALFMSGVCVNVLGSTVCNSGIITEEKLHHHLCRSWHERMW
jgi:hypothetical protein